MESSVEARSDSIIFDFNDSNVAGSNGIIFDVDDSKCRRESILAATRIRVLEASSFESSDRKRTSREIFENLRLKMDINTRHPDTNGHSNLQQQSSSIVLVPRPSSNHSNSARCTQSSLRSPALCC